MHEIELRPARPADFDAIARLLSAAGLPVEDLGVTMLDGFVVATDGEVRVGVVGLQIHESNALLRSLAVEPQHRSRGLGARLVDAIETEARVRGVAALYLLTTTATTFFERLGYTAHDRATVPPSIATTTEFSSLCPGTADCLWRDLET
ncbi:MAG: arsenic resistance N-acetyltransferase ArsN2 [Gammaproteobacteria bacterium]|nr:arsenic resistance N-acetyltransferase ArsN2 [Gammaproteobacteria bacterium]